MAKIAISPAIGLRRDVDHGKAQFGQITDLEKADSGAQEIGIMRGLINSMESTELQLLRKRTEETNALHSRTSQTLI